MKPTILLPFLLFGLGVSAQDVTARYLQKELVQVTDNLYVWPYEVSNGMYNEFLNDLKAEDSIEAEIYAVKSEAWESVLTYAKPFVDYYDSHPAYVDYPVVNITQADAERFCEWLTDKYNQDPKYKFQKAVFRLPTLAEWEQIASDGDADKMFPWGYPYIRNGNGQFMSNFTRVSSECVKYFKDGCYVVDTACQHKRIQSIFAGKLSDKLALTTPVKSFLPTQNGLYNISGNVAEMVTEGVAKGGSWHSLPYYCQIWTDPEFKDNSQPSPMVGFRFVMELVEQQ